MPSEAGRRILMRANLLMLVLFFGIHPAGPSYTPETFGYVLVWSLLCWAAPLALMLVTCIGTPPEVRYNLRCSLAFVVLATTTLLPLGYVPESMEALAPLAYAAPISVIVGMGALWVIFAEHNREEARSEAAE